MTHDVLQKNTLKDGYYYTGYVIQQYCAIVPGHVKIVCRWDTKHQCFWFWDFEGNIKIKTKLVHLTDIDNEIEEGFLPIKQTFPNDDQLID